MFSRKKSPTSGRLFIWAPWNWLVLHPSTLVMNNLKLYKPYSSLCLPCKWRQRIVLRVLYFHEKRWITVWFLKTIPLENASLQLISISLIEAADTVKFCQVESPFRVHLFSTTHLNHMFVRNFFKLRRVISGAKKFRSTAQRILFVGVEKSKLSNLYVLWNQSKCQINFCCTIRFSQDLIEFFINSFRVKCFIAQLNTSTLAVLISE